MPENEEQLVTEEQAHKYRLEVLQKFMGLTTVESEQLVAILTQPTPKSWILSRPIRGGGRAQYVPGYRFIQKFNDAFGFLWSQEFPWFEKVGEEIISKGRWSLQIPGRTVTRKLPNGTEETVRFDGFSIVKEQFGSAQIKKWSKDNPKLNVRRGDVMDLGNDYKAASTDAMKKCGTELGIFLDVYGAREQTESSGPTESQLAAFYTRARACGYDTKEKANAWATEQLEKPFEELNSQEVLGLVADLIDLGRERK